MIRPLVLTLIMALPLAALAADDPVVGKAGDFAAGFKRLVALGLQGLAGAEWVAAGDGPQEMSDYELRDVLKGLKGNGWRLQVEGKPVFLPLGGVAVQEVPSGGRSRGGILGGLLGSGSKAAKGVDPVADATKLTDTLNDPGKSKDFREQLKYRGASHLGRLLIFAAQLDQSGHPAEANKLAAAVFSLGVDPEAVVDAAISLVAARDLGRVTEAFFTTRDWVTYERDLRALVKRYPRGWESAAAVHMLLPAVAKRAAGTPPAKPTLDGITLQPEAVAALDDALRDSKGAPDADAVTRYAKENGIPDEALTPRMREQLAQMLSGDSSEHSGGPWLIEKPSDPESKDPWSRLRRLGLDALPALASVAMDDALTYSRNPSSDNSYSFGGNRKSAEELAVAAYKALARPVSRGELACRMLAAALPGEGHQENEPQELATSAVEFWKSQRGKSKLDLLLVFLAEGDSSQARAASKVLAEMPDAAAHQAFEKHVLESDDLTTALDSVEVYLKLRKAGAKEFFARFSSALKAQLDGADLDEISGGYQIKRAGGVDKYLKNLGLPVSSESPRQLVLELAMAAKPDKQRISALATNMRESSPDEFVSIFLDAAVKAPHMETRVEFLTALMRMSYRRFADAEKAAATKPPDTESPIPAGQLANWKILLDDRRDTSDGAPVADIAASVLEGLCNPGSQQQSYAIYQVDFKIYPSLVLSRCKERIAGKPPTPLPDGSKVSAARLDDLIKQVAAAKADAVYGITRAWTIDEKLAFKKWRDNPEHQLPASVIACRRLLTAPIETIGGPPVAQVAEIMQSLKLKPGTMVDFDLLTKLSTSLTSDSKTNSGLCLQLGEAPLGVGMAITAERAFDAKPGRRFGSFRYTLSALESSLKNSEATAAVAITWSSRGRSGRLLWTHESNKVKPPDADTLEQFRDEMTAWDEPDAKAISTYINVLHRDDLEKLATLNGDDSENSDD